MRHYDDFSDVFEGLDVKSYSYLELKKFSDWLNEKLVGAQLQDAWTYEQGLVLQFYRQQEIFLWIDGNQAAPLVSALNKKPPIAKKQKPLGPFLNSHAKNLKWAGSDVDIGKGRVLEIALKAVDKFCLLEIQLIPKSFNILAQTTDKKISWEKPRDLPASLPQKEQADAQEIANRDWFALGQEHLKDFLSPKIGKSNMADDPRPRAVEKKEKALLMMRVAQSEDLSIAWQAFGEHLKISQEIPEQFAKFYKSSMSVAENRENAFRQAKLLKKKKSGNLERIQILENEIQKLKQEIQTIPYQSIKTEKASFGQMIMKKTESRGRKLKLSEQVDAVMGKSAKDNIDLLRAAQPTDLWLHLKDEPSAHVILVKPKNLEVPLSLIQQASDWLMTEMYTKKNRLAGRYEVIVVECRHVKPLKGDKHGRVTYHHGKTYSFVFSLASK